MAERSGEFQGGIHPAYRKEATSQLKVEPLALPPAAIVSLQQHIGARCRPLVKIGDRVKVGTRIGETEAFVSAPVHASISGKVVQVAPQPHPIGMPVEAVVIEADGADTWEELPQRDAAALSTAELRKVIHEAGIVGLGGAAFPTHVKLSPPAEKPIDTLIINGAECEPYLSADHRLMVERTADLLEGAVILSRILGVGRVFIGVEANKPDAITALKASVGGRGGITVLKLPVKYPQGAEKQLIKTILNREVPPPPGLPMDVGVVVQNVGTTLAILEAVRDGKPLVERVVTVSGSGIARPANLRVRIGTPFKFLVEACGGLAPGAVRVLMGGPMMGLAQHTLEAPVIKGTSGLVVLTREDLQLRTSRACIRCGRCVRACPMTLSPQTIVLYARHELFEKAEQSRALDCIECGCCSFSCPASIPLVHYLRHAKGQILATRKKRKERQAVEKGA